MRPLDKALVYLTSLDEKLKSREDNDSIDTRGKILLIKKFVEAEIKKQKEFSGESQKTTNLVSKNYIVGNIYSINFKDKTTSGEDYIGDGIFLGDSKEKGCGRFKIPGWDDCFFPYDSVF